MTVYLDCAATTPIEPEVLKVVIHYMSEEYGNAGSRTHEFGARAQQAVQKARDQVAAVVSAKRDEVVFTSGATESNNLAILGLAPHGEATGRKHIVSTQIEHKAVLEPLEALAKRGFEVTLVPPTEGGWVDPAAVKAALRKDTLLVSVMHVNNETGVIQPLTEVAELLARHPAYFHVDAAQGFGKDLPPLKNQRIDMISVSGHKIYAPKGVGALIVRRRGYEKVPLTPLMYGGGQERGLRPGTVAVPLVVGLGLAAEMAVRDADARTRLCMGIRERAVAALLSLDPSFHGDLSKSIPHVINLSIGNVDSEAIMVACKGLLAVSNGSACTSASYQPTHVLTSMRLPPEMIQGALRISWSHLSSEPNWQAVIDAVVRLR